MAYLRERSWTQSGFHAIPLYVAISGLNAWISSISVYTHLRPIDVAQITSLAILSL